MKDIKSIPSASKEMLTPDETGSIECENSKKVQLAKALESRQISVICVGRSLVTIRRCENGDVMPAEVVNTWGTLRIDIYADPDVGGDEIVQSIYITGDRYGFGKLFQKIGDKIDKIGRFV